MYSCHSLFFPFSHRCPSITTHLVSTLPQPRSSTGPWPRLSTVLREVSRCRRQHSQQVREMCLPSPPLTHLLLHINLSCPLRRNIQVQRFIPAHSPFLGKMMGHYINSLWEIIGIRRLHIPGMHAKHSLHQLIGNLLRLF